MSEDTGQRGYPVLKVKLREDWYACTQTTASLEFGTPTGKILDFQTGLLVEPKDFSRLGGQDIYLDDPSGQICKEELAALLDETTQKYYIPAGFVCLVARPQDAFDGHYELLHAGKPCEGSSSSGSSASSSQPSSSQPSGSSASSSEPSSSQPSSSEPSSSEPSSESPSSGGPSSGGPSSGGSSAGCACIPHPPEDSSESSSSEEEEESEHARLKALSLVAPKELYWNKEGDGTYTSRYGVEGGIAQHSVPGTTGNIIYYQPEIGVNYKKIIFYLNGFTGTVTINFPYPFTYSPFVSGLGVVAMLTADSVTITAIATTGYLTLEGF